MSLLTNLKNILESKNKFSSHTIKNYYNNVNKLKMLLNSNNDNIKDLLYDSSKVFNVIDKNIKSLSSKKLMYTILKRLAEILELPNKDDYIKKMNIVNDSLNEIIRSNKLCKNRINRRNRNKDRNIHFSF